MASPACRGETRSAVTGRDPTRGSTDARARVTTIATRLADGTLLHESTLPPPGNVGDARALFSTLPTLSPDVPGAEDLTDERVSPEQFLEAIRTESIDTITAMLEEINLFSYELDGETPMHAAVAAGRVDVVRLLLSRNLVLSAKFRSEGWSYRLSPIGLAIYLKQIPCLEAILTGTQDLDLVGHGYVHGNLVHLAVETGSLAALALLKKHPQWETLSSEASSFIGTPEALASHLQDFDAMALITDRDLPMEEALSHVYPTTWVFDKLGIETLGALRLLPKEAFANAAEMVATGSGTIIALLLALGAEPLEIIDRLKSWSPLLGQLVEQGEVSFGSEVPPIEILQHELQRAICELSEKPELETMGDLASLIESRPEMRHLTLYNYDSVENLIKLSTKNVRTHERKIVECIVNCILNPASCGNEKRRTLYFQRPDTEPPVHGLSMVIADQQNLEMLIETQGRSCDNSMEAARIIVSAFNRQIQLTADPLLRKMRQVGIDVDFLPPRSQPRCEMLRNLELDLVDREDEGGVVITRRSLSGHKILHGGLKVGKNVLAAQFIRTCCPNYLLYVVNGKSEESVRDSYLHIATGIGCHVEGYETLSSLQEIVHQKLTDTHMPWILYIHNAYGVLPLPATPPSGICLVTTRNANSWQYADLTETNNLSEAQAIEFMISELGGSSAYRSILQFVGAVAHLNSPKNLVECLECFQLVKSLDSEALFIDFVAQILTEDNRSIERRMWQTVFERFREKHPAAAELLQVLAWMGDDVIPIPWVDQYVQRHMGNEDCELLLQLLAASPFCRFDGERQLITLRNSLKGHITATTKETLAEHTLQFLTSLKPFDKDQAMSWAEGLIWASHLTHLIPIVLRGATYSTRMDLREPMKDLGDCFFVHGRLPEALAAYIGACETVHSESVSYDLADLHLKIGKIRHLRRSAEEIGLSSFNIALNHLGALDRKRYELEERLSTLREQQGDSGEEQRAILTQTRHISAQEVHLRRASVLHSIGDFVRDHGHHAHALEYYRGVVTYGANINFEFNKSTATMKMHLAHASYMIEAHEEGLQHANEALEIFTTLSGQTLHPDIARVHYLRALGLKYLCRIPEALNVGNDAYKILSQLYPKFDNPDLAEICDLLAEIYFENSQYEKALELSKQAQAIAERFNHDQPHPLIAKTLRQQAKIYEKQENIIQCVRCLQKSVQIYRSLFPAARTHTEPIEGQAGGFVRVENWLEALPYYLEACEIYEVWDQDYPSKGLEELAKSKYAANNPEAAIQRRQEAILEVVRKEQDAAGNDPSLRDLRIEKARLQIGIALAQNALNKYEEACTYLDQAVQTLGSPEACAYAMPIAGCALAVARRLRNAGSYQKAIPYFKDGIELLLHISAQEPFSLNYVCRTLVQGKVEENDLDAAITLNGGLIELLRTSLHEGNSPYTPQELIQLYVFQYELLVSQGKMNDARDAINAALAKWEELYPDANEIAAPCITQAALRNGCYDLPHLFDAHQVYLHVDGEQQNSVEPLKRIISDYDLSRGLAYKAAYQRGLVRILESRLVADQPTQEYADALVQLFGTLRDLGDGKTVEIFEAAYTALRQLHPELVPFAEIPETQGRAKWTGVNQLECFTDALAVFSADLRQARDDLPARLRIIAGNRKAAGSCRRAVDYLTSLLRWHEVQQQAAPEQACTVSHGLTLQILALAETDLSERWTTTGKYELAHEHMREAVRILQARDQDVSVLQGWLQSYQQTWGTTIRSWLPSWPVNVVNPAPDGREGTE